MSFSTRLCTYALIEKKYKVFGVRQQWWASVHYAEGQPLGIGLKRLYLPQLQLLSLSSVSCFTRLPLCIVKTGGSLLVAGAIHSTLYIFDKRKFQWMHAVLWLDKLVNCDVTAPTLLFFQTEHALHSLKKITRHFCERWQRHVSDSLCRRAAT